MGKLLLTVLVVVGCMSSKKNLQNSQSNLMQPIQMDSVVYEAISRGFYEKMKVVKDSIYFEKKRPDSYAEEAISLENWENLQVEVNYIPLKDISKVEPPTKYYQFDGSAMANLSVWVNSKEFKSQTFDKDNPPKVFKETLKLISYLKNTYLDH